MKIYKWTAVVTMAIGCAMLHIFGNDGARSDVPEDYPTCYSRKIDECRRHWKGLQYECRAAAKVACRNTAR